MLALICCDVFDCSHAELCLDFDTGCQMHRSHQPWSRSSKIAAIAGDTSILGPSSFNPASGGGWAPGRRRPAAMRRSRGLLGMGIIFATSWLFLVMDTAWPVRWTIAMISDARSFNSLIPTDLVL